VTQERGEVLSNHRHRKAFDNMLLPFIRWPIPVSPQ